ncbi:hypothetical protein FOMPIDRAFT_1055758 [Fomitopsis schrenkii]|uniref:Uncharacterized protein n=1 Tax=Fomitopsis schrenkii TaxID=2126942 RepID=S8F441_FOMSC|nr:hypothetical protein FOMPIDRAFT_1055758 [Fomitopsis schrenkii]
MGYKLLSALVLGALSTLPVAGTVFLLVKIVVDSVDAILMPVFASAHVACGEGGEVFTNTTFTSKNKEVRVVTRACPGFVERRSLEKRVTSSNLQKRQDIICSYDASVLCEDLGSEPLLAGCDDLYDALADYGTEEFEAPADTLTTFTTNDECVFAFANPSVVYYDVCYETVGELGLAVADDCYSYGGGYGEVASPDWYVE